MKKQTLRQLQLTATEVGTQMDNYLMGIVTSFDKIFIWTDRVVCLHWIAKNDSTVPCVKNQVVKILGLQSNFQFKHVSSKDTAADVRVCGW